MVAPLPFHETDGFRFATTLTPAKVLPQYGLVFATFLDGEFPIEEQVHTLSLSRTPLNHAKLLREYWTDPEGRLDTVRALDPIIEALNRTHLDYFTHPGGQPLAEDNEAYRDSFTRQMQREHDIDYQFDWGAYEQLASDLAAVLEKCTDETVAPAALDAYFLELFDVRDLDEARRAAVVYQALEVLLFYQLTQMDATVDAVEAHSDTAAEIAADWRRRADDGRVPFTTDPSEFNYELWFLSQWAGAIQRVGTSIATAIRETEHLHEPHLGSLPAVAQLVHPLLANHWLLSTTATHLDRSLPWAVFSPDDGLLGLYRTSIPRDRIEANLEWWTARDCHLYTGETYEHWFVPQLRMQTTVTAYAEIGAAFADQVLSYFQNLESLWSPDQMGKAPDCLHCKVLRDTLARQRSTDGETLLTHLQRGTFSEVDDDYIAETGRAYADWLAQRATATIDHHPLL